jgi:xanthine/CO dehydrogenase XdhC/CoxF family maturation factor
VIRIAGSAYRRPGAKLLIEETGGGTLGSVSGGCLEADVREIAAAVLATGDSCLRRYDTADEAIAWGLGLGCNGLVEVFVQPATEGPLAVLAPRLRELLAEDAAFALVTVVENTAGDGARPGAILLIEPGGVVCGTLGAPDLDVAAGDGARAVLTAGHSDMLTMAGCRLFVEVQTPPRHLLICGAGDDARPLVAYAADAGFRVTLLDHRPGLLEPAWFPRATRLVVARPEDEELALSPPSRSLAVVKTHSLAHDREWARRLLGAGFPYVGLLGPRARTAAILHDIQAEAAAGERVFGPVGLDLGADGPRQVAFSIVAELLAVIAGREPRHLSERREAIHAG